MRNYFLLFTGFMFLAQFSHAEEDWKSRMRSLAKEMGQLVPYLATQEKFDAPESAPKIQESLNNVSAIAKDLSLATKMHGQKKSPQHGSDPIFPYMAESFGDNVLRAKEVLASGNKKYARQLAQNSFSYCMGCHSRNESKTNLKFSFFGNSLESLPLADRMKMLAASRKFDEAIAEFDHEIEAGKLPTGNSFDLETSSRLALSLSVRVARSPTRSLETLDKLLARKELAPSFKAELLSWQKGLNDWKKEKVGPLETEKELFTAANSLVKNAEKKKSFPMDRAAEIDYLRASSLLHDLLDIYPKTDLAAKAMLLLGRCYDVLQDLGFWSLHEVYYEACIRQAPHTPTAQDCFKNYERSMVLGYSGSSGVHIPSEVSQKIEELKKLQSSKR